ncbi:MAG: hypothetical protein Q9P14_05000 [candidate division KSB1 bacterium]|nr:hypothetical protein [candidate division KSB1 bacterium]MDQ7064310.1 hypothetical protein [candidate division KSB1 bacterium]
MPCPEILEQICAELKENIDSPICQDLKKHLEGCPECRAYVDSLKKTVYLYRHLPEQTVPEEVQDRLYKVLKLKE